MFLLTPALRWIPPRLDTLEIEASPLYTFAPELYSHTLNQLGLRLGMVWHIDCFIRGKIAEKERIRQEEIAEQQRIERERQEEEAERKQAEIEWLKRETEKASEDEAARIAEEEARRAEIASWGNPVAAILAQSAVNFTPDERYGDSFAVNSVYRRNA